MVEPKPFSPEPVTDEEARVRLFTRGGHDVSRRYPSLIDAVSCIAARHAAILDGEIAVHDAHGVTRLSQMGDIPGGELVYYAFDLLYLDGQDLRGRPLLERKRLLKTVLKRAGNRVLYSEHFCDGRALLAEMCRRGGEGIVSKRADSRYRAGGCRDWVKIKCHTWHDEHRRATANWVNR
jgi:bifunctional non-homologous end joining protein LigD